MYEFLKHWVKVRNRIQDVNVSISFLTGIEILRVRVTPSDCTSFTHTIGHSGRYINISRLHPVFLFIVSVTSLDPFEGLFIYRQTHTRDRSLVDIDSPFRGTIKTLFSVSVYFTKESSSSVVRIGFTELRESGRSWGRTGVGDGRLDNHLWRKDGDE